MAAKFDLDIRTERFAVEVRTLIRRLPRTLCNSVDAKQLVRSSGSVGANYLEANEALGSKDFRYRIKISRKEAKESGYWLRLLDCRDIAALAEERERLEDEARQLVRIFTAILRNHSCD